MGEAFSAAGWRVWLTDIDATALGTCPADWHADRVDVCDEAAMSDLFARIRSEWGGLDALCANAGIAGETALTEEQDITAFRRWLMSIWSEPCWPCEVPCR